MSLQNTKNNGNYEETLQKINLLVLMTAFKAIKNFWHKKNNYTFFHVRDHCDTK